MNWLIELTAMSLGTSLFVGVLVLIAVLGEYRVPDRSVGIRGAGLAVVVALLCSLQMIATSAEEILHADSPVPFAYRLLLLVISNTGPVVTALFGTAFLLAWQMLREIRRGLRGAASAAAGGDKRIDGA